MTLTGTQDITDDVVEVLPTNDGLAAIGVPCDENPEDPLCKGVSYHGDNVDGFSAWVRSVPSEWGCIRGRLVSSVAGPDRSDADLDALTFTSAEEAAAHLAGRGEAPANRRGDAPGRDNGSGNGPGNGAGNGNGSGVGKGGGSGPGNGDHRSGRPAVVAGRVACVRSATRLR